MKKVIRVTMGNSLCDSKVEVLNDGKVVQNLPCTTITETVDVVCDNVVKLTIPICFVEIVRTYK